MAVNILDSISRQLRDYLQRPVHLCPPDVVMKFTGHCDYKSMKPYIDIAEKAKTDAMDAMDKALGKN